MSLLLLTENTEQFQALDDAGAPLPNAVLTFWRSGTTAPLAVYSDSALSTQLSNAAGQVTADADGIFPFIYLQDAAYRVLLKTADGVLRFDIDPYVCDCTDPPYQWRPPRYRAIDGDGITLPGATLSFYATTTLNRRNTYADAELAIAHPNPLEANAAGIFPPVYLDDAITYRVIGADAGGAELFDVDPYVCECGPPPPPVIVVVGDSAGQIARSDDGGATWTYPTLINRQYHDVAFSPTLGSGQGRFCAVSSNNFSTQNVVTSDDGGLTWTLRAFPATFNALGVTWVPELALFIATGKRADVADLDMVMTSPDGITWTERTAQSAGAQGGKLAWSPELGRGVYRPVNKNEVMRSSDGINWATATVTGILQNTDRSLVWAPGRERFFALQGSDFWYSDDGIAWTELAGVLGGFGDLAYSPSLDRLVIANAAGGTGAMRYSDDGGLTWNAADAVPVASWRCIVRSEEAGLYVASASGRLLLSTNGIAWTSVTTPNLAWEAVAFGEGL